MKQSARQLVDLLRPSPTANWPAPRETIRFDRAFDPHPTVIAEYIEPDLQPASFSEFDGFKPLLLVAAPGAVGKSSLASFLASRSGSPLWRLEHVRIGDGTISQLLVDAYGAKGYAQILQGISDGQYSILFDSLDETLIRADAYAALSSLAEDLKAILDEATGDHPSVVIMGRVESISLLHLELEHLRVPHSCMEIDYFDRERSFQFVERQLQDTDQFSDTALEEIFERFLTLLDAGRDPDQSRADAWDRPTIRSFLGYAPVLNSIAKLMDSGGHPSTSEVTQLPESSGPDYWGPIVDLCSKICVRENEKLTSRLREDFDLEGPVYQTSDQVDLLLSRAALIDRFIFPDWLPTERHTEYQTAIEGQLNQHPFLNPTPPSKSTSCVTDFANPIFFEFLIAHAATSMEPERLAEVLAKLSEWGPISTTPVFGRILLRMSHERRTRIPSSVLSLLTSSLSSSRSTVPGALVVLEEDLQLGSVGLSVSVADDASIAGRIEFPADLTMLDLSGEIAHVAVATPSLSVCLGAPGSSWQHLSISGSVSVECLDLVVGTPDISLLGDTHLDLQVHGQIVDRFHSVPNLSETSSIRLRILHTDLPYPWESFRTGRPPRRDGSALAEAATQLRQLWSAIHCNLSHTGAVRGLRCYRGGLEATVNGTSNNIKPIFRYALSTGLLEPAGGDLLLVRLDRFNLSAAAIRACDYSDESLLDFLAEYVRQLPS